MGELLKVAQAVLGGARQGEELEAYAVHRTSTTVQAGTGGVIRHVGRAETRGVGVRLLAHGRMGYASTADLSREGLAATVARAHDNTAAADVDEAVALPGRQPSAGATTSLWAEALERTPLETKIGLAADLARRVTTLDARIRSIDTAEYSDERVVTAVASTRGVASEDRRGYAELSADAIAESCDGDVSDYGYWCGRDPAGIDVDALAGEAVERTVRLLGRPTGRSSGAAVVLDRAVVGALLAAVGRGCSGGALSSGRSVFAGRRGESVAATGVTVVDDGRHPAAPAASRLDDEGVPRRRTELVREGVLVGALHTTTTARAVGGAATSTGNARRATHKAPPAAAPSAVMLQPTCPLPELLSAAGDAIYLQQLAGAHSGISPVTGRVTAGATGVRWLRGQPAGRLATVPVATSLTAVLASILMVGDDIRPVPGTPVLASTVLCSPVWLRL